jgi:hypothetical protein
MTVRSVFGVALVGLVACALSVPWLVTLGPVVAQQPGAAFAPPVEITPLPIGRYELSASGDKMLDSVTGILYAVAGESWQVAATLPALRTIAPAPTPAAGTAVQLRTVGPAAAAVGQTIEFVIDATNSGTAPLQAVSLRAEHDRALLKPEAATTGIPATGELLWSQLTFAPGETRRFRIECRCLAEGQTCLKVAATTADGLRTSQEACVTIGPAAVPTPAASFTQ